MNNLYVFLVALAITLTLTILILIKLIPYLKSKKVGQKILEIGPRWHKSKEGTPTMGGIAFIIATIIAFVLSIVIFKNNISKRELVLSINILFYAVLNALIGLIDDIAKMKKAVNQGLTPKMKFAFQSVAAILFLISMHYTCGMNTSLFIPFLNKTYSLGVFYYILAYLLLCGIVNSVNLTDGLDGLASSVSLSVGFFFTLISFLVYNDFVITLLGGAIIGSTIGFLVFNLYPARVFMGDIGSLFLGALIVSASFAINNPLLVVIYGFVFVIEALSDIIQVVYFKISKGKRVFKMAPLHHHFEKSGWSEMRIVSVFTILNSIFCIFAYFGLNNL